MVFPPNWYDYKVSYAHPFGSIAAVLLTCAFLYASLAKNERISKGRYVLCGGIALIFPVLAALYFQQRNGVSLLRNIGHSIPVVNLGIWILQPTKRGTTLFPSGAAAGSCTACGGMAAGIPATHSSAAFGFTDRPIFSGTGCILSVDGTGHSAPVRVLSAAAEQAMEGRCSGSPVGAGVCRGRLRNPVQLPKLV